MSYYFLCSQNKDSINNRFVQLLISYFVAAEFPKTPSPKPARIHSPDPFLRAESKSELPPKKISRGKAKNPFPRKKEFRFASSALKPHALPEYLEGRTPKEKHPFLFQEKIHPRENQRSKEHFFFLFLFVSFFLPLLSPISLFCLLSIV